LCWLSEHGKIYFTVIRDVDCECGWRRLGHGGREKPGKHCRAAIYFFFGAGSRISRLFFIHHASDPSFAVWRTRRPQARDCPIQSSATTQSGLVYVSPPINTISIARGFFLHTTFYLFLLVLLSLLTCNNFFLLKYLEGPQVLVKLCAAGVNPVETYIRSGIVIILQRVQSVMVFLCFSLTLPGQNENSNEIGKIFPPETCVSKPWIQQLCFLSWKKVEICKAKISESFCFQFEILLPNFSFHFTGNPQASTQIYPNYPLHLAARGAESLRLLDRRSQLFESVNA
jgi:hypothetical protein